jgi:hypothetical protein
MSCEDCQAWRLTGPGAAPDTPTLDKKPVGADMKILRERMTRKQTWMHSKTLTISPVGAPRLTQVMPRKSGTPSLLQTHWKG